ncbi:hypothetical protein JOM56_000931 [Amanita muscaria]
MSWRAFGRSPYLCHPRESLCPGCFGASFLPFHLNSHAISGTASPYPAGELTLRPRATSPTWTPGPGHAYAADASRAETPWGPGYAGGQDQVPQAGGYAQPPFPLPMAMAGQEFSQQPVFRSGPFGHTVAWHAQQQMRQQSLSRPSSVSPQFPYTPSMFSAGGGHFQLGGPAVPSPIIAGSMRVGSGQPASTIVAGAVRTGNPQLENLILPSPVVPGDSHYRAFGQGHIDEEPEETKEVGTAQGRKSRQGSKDDRQESR